VTDAAETAAAISALARLNKWGGPRLVRDMTAIFSEEMPRRLAEVKNAFERNDSDAAGRASHSIKSSAGQLGAVALAGVAAEMERLVESSGMEQARELVGEMEKQLEQFLAWLAQNAGTPAGDQ